MNNAIQLEDKVSRSRSKHEGEPSTGNLRQAFGRTRGSSQRQLPTDHDYAVSTREYQLDQSSPLPATAAADPVLVRKKRPAHLDRSLHINFRLGGDTPVGIVRAECVPLLSSARGRSRTQMVACSVEVGWSHYLQVCNRFWKDRRAVVFDRCRAGGVPLSASSLAILTTPQQV